MVSGSTSRSSAAKKSPGSSTIGICAECSNQTSVFDGFATFWLGEKLSYNHLVGFALIAAGAFFIFRGPIAA